MAETVKHACLADKEFFEYIEDHVEDVLACVPEVCEYISGKNCNVKYQVVMKDEKEKSLREILNLGHTYSGLYRQGRTGTETVHR